MEALTVSETIYNAKLIDLIPPNMVDNAQIQAYCAAFDAMDAIVAAAISNVNVLTNIGGQSSEVTDMLALQQHIDYYNQSLPLETRQNLVKGSGFVHKMQGTPAAVEQVARLVFGSATVQEWFEYGGEPYHFRVLIDEFPDSDGQMSEINRAISSAQNARSYLDNVIIIASTATASVYIAGVIQMAVNINITQKQ
jgi:P2-related tail formation protein